MVVDCCAGYQLMEACARAPMAAARAVYLMSEVLCNDMLFLALQPAALKSIGGHWCQWRACEICFADFHGIGRTPPFFGDTGCASRRLRNGVGRVSLSFTYAHIDHRPKLKCLTGIVNHTARASAMRHTIKRRSKVAGG